MTLSSIIKRHGMLFALIGLTVLLGVFSIAYLQPQLLNDSPGYIEAMGIVAGNPPPAEYVPTRILTTFGGLSLVLLLAPLFGILKAWLVMNFVFFVMIAVASFFLFRALFENERVAFLGALCVVGNYGPIVFGLHYLMDAGGWAFYLLALLGVGHYLMTRAPRAILWAAVAVGVGGLFKEYALLGCIAIAVALVWGFATNPYRERLHVLWLMAATAFIAIFPVALVHVYVYNTFGYTYLEWARYNKEVYVYASRTIEYGKALGSLLNLVALPAFMGLVLWGTAVARAGVKALESPRNIAICAVVLSALPIFVWGGITQRVLFVLVPAAALFACFVFERYEKRWYWFVPPLGLYVAASFFMDMLLETINLPF